MWGILSGRDDPAALAYFLCSVFKISLFVGSRACAANDHVNSVRINK